MLPLLYVTPVKVKTPEPSVITVVGLAPLIKSVIDLPVIELLLGSNRVPLIVLPVGALPITKKLNDVIGSEVIVGPATLPPIEAYVPFTVADLPMRLVAPSAEE